MKTRFLLLGALSVILMLGCNPGEKKTPVAKSGGTGASTGNKVVIPPSYTGEFNPSGLSVGVSEGSLAPEIEGKDLDGAPFKLSDYRGKVVMLDFWGDW